MDRPLQIALIVGVFTLTFVVFEHSENGRYQYSTKDEVETVIDSRTGEYWQFGGGGHRVHVNARSGEITVHVPHVKDARVFDRCMDGKSQIWLLHPVAMHICTDPPR